ncbi:carboxypeptidase-like regulatory domain-containing protein [Alloacidobacterium sp.]|uniref:carboxypeptidase-like regulatory domain-containing protein n=1 Tax=Alloacidobacterium sp. TaxID=2951999 RepID=UPI002D58B411|nr:carboxypeptidase-like regulatory domain-containing protein [Alloacidobacterium sp.]HYK35735.1 carboxypeptidase-like regulatory domain-containing protein [Alloacidobacterium sp.]
MQILIKKLHNSISEPVLKRMWLALIIAMCAIFSSAFIPAFGQTSFGRISGTVSAPDGSVIPGAQVTVRNADTQLTRQTATDSQGFYVFTELLIGI